MKNWKPVSLLRLDYKILSKCLTNWLKGCLDTIVHREQAYCVPGWTIMDNLFILRDVIDITRMYDQNLWFISKDQEKDIDRVCHVYLLRIMEAFGLVIYRV